MSNKFGRKVMVVLAMDLKGIPDSIVMPQLFPVLSDRIYNIGLNPAI